jgi:uncharacterized protein (DUF1697 family)
MTAIVSMLRGVNVGGHNKIKMEALRDLFTALGLHNPRTHIQSGNVIFGSKDSSLPALSSRIAKAIEKELGVKAEVILRSAAELEEAVDRNPFAGRDDVPPNRLVVTFLSQAPPDEAKDAIRKLNGGPEELHLEGRELYIYFPNGISGSKIPPTAIDRAVKVSGTARNWNTVTKLLELAREL